MARHDYDLPADYEQRVEDGTMCEWYEEERDRRMVKMQDTHDLNQHGFFARAARGVKRKVKAKAGSVSLENWR